VPVRIKCPRCKAGIVAPSKLIGRLIGCPRCDETFAVEGPISKPPDPAPPRPQAAATRVDLGPPLQPRCEIVLIKQAPADLPHGRGKPHPVQTAGQLMLAGGIVALAWSLLTLVLSLGACFLWPGWIYAVVSGILAIVRGSLLLGPNACRSGPARWAAIMLIINVLNLDLVSPGLGIVALVMLNRGEARDYFDP
jgi:hypothetical protein